MSRRLRKCYRRTSFHMTYWELNRPIDKCEHKLGPCNNFELTNSFGNCLFVFYVSLPRSRCISYTYFQMVKQPSGNNNSNKKKKTAGEFPVDDVNKFVARFCALLEFLTIQSHMCGCIYTNGRARVHYVPFPVPQSV